MSNLQLSLLGWKSYQIPITLQSVQVSAVATARKKARAMIVFMVNWWFCKDRYKDIGLNIFYRQPLISGSNCTGSWNVHNLFNAHWVPTIFSSCEKYWSNMIIFWSLKNCLISSFSIAIDQKSIQFALACLSPLLIYKLAVHPSIFILLNNHQLNSKSKELFRGGFKGRLRGGLNFGFLQSPICSSAPTHPHTVERVCTVKLSKVQCQGVISSVKKLPWWSFSDLLSRTGGEANINTPLMEAWVMIMLL